MRALHLLRCLCAALALAGLVSTSTPAHAQADPAARVAELVELASADYDTLALDGAQAKLAEAIVLVESAGVQTPAAAQAYILSGVINFALTGDSASALNPFVEALIIDPGAEILPSMRRPRCKR